MHDEPTTIADYTRFEFREYASLWDAKFEVSLIALRAKNVVNSSSINEF
jgi:hypothetical protein